MQPAIPVSLAERSHILDILRGIALFGICLANYPMFSLYIFQKPETTAAMPTAVFDKWIPYLHFALIDGKFYTLFSLLFGVGFSIILLRNNAKGKTGLAIFYRRLIILASIGLAHMGLLWEGDILLLYALIGMLLPLFRNVSDKNLLVFCVVLIFSPLIFDAVKVLSDNKWNLSLPLAAKAMQIESGYGITGENFRNWQAIHTDYASVLKYNHAGFFWRWEHLLGSNRVPKVLGIFLLGLYVGRKMIYLKLKDNIALLRKTRRRGFIIGLPASIAYAYLELNGPRFPDPLALLGTLAYAVSVVPLSLAYTASICLWFLSPGGKEKLTIFAAPGRMALTNYLLQTLIAVFIFYGIGLGYGAKTGLLYVSLIAIGVYIFEVVFSHFWLRHFHYGPVEWVWRQLTYGKRLKLTRK